MKKTLLTCLLSLSLIGGAFAATSSLVRLDADCDVKKECAAKDNKGCPVDYCFFTDSGGTLSVSCKYKHCDGGDLEIQ